MILLMMWMMVVSVETFPTRPTTPHDLLLGAGADSRTEQPFRNIHVGLLPRYRYLGFRGMDRIISDVDRFHRPAVPLPLQSPPPSSVCDITSVGAPSHQPSCLRTHHWGLTVKTDGRK
jgi:hypothetical protein